MHQIEQRTALLDEVISAPRRRELHPHPVPAWERELWNQELAERFADQRATREGAINEVADLL